MEPGRVEHTQLWMSLAEEKLEVARELLSLSRYDDVVSKAYYVMFYAAKAALLTVGVDLRKHSGVVSLFGREFVKTGYADRRYSRILARAMQAREASDYDPTSRATREVAEQAIVNAQEFLDKARELLAKVTDSE